MSKIKFGQKSTITLFKKQVEIESTSDNLKRFEFNKGNPVTFEKKDVVEGFKAYSIDLENDYTKIYGTLPNTVELDKLLVDFDNGELDIAVKLDLDNDFFTNKFNEIIKLDSISIYLRRTPDGEENIEANTDTNAG